MNKLYTVNPETGRWMEVKELFYAKEIKNLNGFLIENPNNKQVIINTKNKLVYSKEDGCKVVHNSLGRALNDFAECIEDWEIRNNV